MALSMAFCGTPLALKKSNELQEPLNGTSSPEGVPFRFCGTLVRRSPTAARGFTLIELMIVIAIVGILASVAIPWLLQARIAAHESAAIVSLRAINDAQAAYRSACGRGWYAAKLPGLGQPMPTTGVAFISPDLSAADVVQKSGYTIAMGSTNPDETRPGCNGVATTAGYHVIADPTRPGRTGNRHFATNASGAIYHHAETLEGKMPDSGAAGAGVELK